MSHTEQTETLLEKLCRDRKNRTIDPHGVFVKRGEIDEDVTVQLLERFRDGVEVV